MVMRWIAVAPLIAAALAVPQAAQKPGLQTSDLAGLRSVGDVSISPDGRSVVYAVVNSDQPGRPYPQVWLLDVASGRSRRLGGDTDSAAEARFSPDGRRLAFIGRIGSAEGLMVASSDGSAPRLIAPIAGTNHPLPSSGDVLAWSPDSTRVAFISATPGPEADANGDPMVITRYLYKPTASEGDTRANDNRRLHLFVADIASKAVRQITDGIYYEHSIDWSPRGDEILFVSNRSPDPDRVFNYDVFAVNVASRAVRRLTETKSAEYSPRWSPDGRHVAFIGTERPLTSSETTLEDTHVWVMGADGGARRHVGGQIDNRQGPPRWSADGNHLYFTLQERGHVRLLRLPASGGTPDRIVDDRGSVGAWALARDGTLAYGFTTAASPSELYIRTPEGSPRAMSALNRTLLAERTIGDVESFTYRSVDGLEIEAFLTRPTGLAATQKAPLVTVIHGGPHGQQGPAFNARAQIYAAHGFASLMVNYRGSTGYGQKLADAIFQDQNGGEARDVLAGVDAAIARYSWIDGTRLGVEGLSYGGQLTNWLITQTDRFRAAVPVAGISNLVSFNYMAYYHDYLAVEFGGFPHEPFVPLNASRWPAPRPKTIMDALWERSPIRHVARVKTPTLFLHGENDNDVPIAEAEQFFIALKDVGVETVLVRYPREGHGIREVRHVEDTITRSLAWYDKHFGAARPTREPQ